MKNYKKATLTMMMLATLPLFAATSNEPIKVTTFVDEENNPNTCSLREALEAAFQRKSYGGCIVNLSPSSLTPEIQLEKGTYLLDKELTPKVDVAIFGQKPLNDYKKSVLTNNYPAQIALETTIDARNNSRIFNTTGKSTALTLNNIVLKNGKTLDKGGAIYASGNVNLSNAQIINSHAGDTGGAIYLIGPATDLSITSSLIQNNKAASGSVLGMSCNLNDNKYSKRKIDIVQSSLIENGSSDSASMLFFCGESNVTLQTNTIASNIANLSNGNLIKFSGDTKPGDAPDNKTSILSSTSSINMKSNTIVENTANTIFLYDKLGEKNLDYNVLAYNQGGLACRYLLGDASALENSGIKILNYNAFMLTGNNKCDLPASLLKNETDVKHTNIDISSKNNIRDLLSPRTGLSENTAFLPIYYPKITNDKALDLVDVGKENADDCSPFDQRGLTRVLNKTLYFDQDGPKGCDIGSVGLIKFSVSDIKNLFNGSLTTELVDRYQDQIKQLELFIKNTNNSDEVAVAKERLELFKKLLVKTQENLHYRAIYIDLNDSKIVLPEETEQPDGTHRLQFFDTKLYDVTTEPLGIGRIDDKTYTVSNKDLLVCEWNSDLEQIIFYRKVDGITQAGDFEYCKFTVRSKPNNPKYVESSGLIEARFTNIAPVAENTSITMRYEKQDKVAINLLNFANDDGDSGKGGLGPENDINKPKFWRNADGIELPIRLSELPDRNLIITADRKGACPEPDQKEICYGGNIYVQEANTFNPFSYSFKYQVYDADKRVSNMATVSVISTAKPANSGGGGSTTVFSLLGLMSLLVIRRFKK
ncbi:CSLREA domain-containing protein [Acinetobacter beijerinckii]|uniref:CSLREA domain-containing protein n=1 Tax=Acinetobacter beijerinckii TaxID=262668 RepID=UPI004054EEF3